MTTTIYMQNYYLGDSAGIRWGGVYFGSLRPLIEEGKKYVEALQIVDLEEESNFPGALLIQEVVIEGFENDTLVKRALSLVGMTPSDVAVYIPEEEVRRLVVADALLKYGGDHICIRESFVFQTNPQGAMQKSDGKRCTWIVDYRLLPDETFEEYFALMFTLSTENLDLLKGQLDLFT
jgi:hypothetical protein